MQKTTENRTIALAALFQCVEGVRQIAHDGYVNEELFNTCLGSVANNQAENIVDIYGGMEKLRTGFRVLLFQLGSGNITPDGKQKNLETTRYAINLLHLEKKLDAHPQLFERLVKGIEEIERQSQHFGPTDETIINHLAEIYAETISNMAPRIMVKGDQNHLGKKENATKIRALLLAGIRAAVLWRQAGGNRWKLILERGKMQRQSEAFLKSE